MRWRAIVVVGLVLLLSGTVPASAQMMGDGGGMMEMMGPMMGSGRAPAASHCPGMVGQPVAFEYEAPWISLALAHAGDLSLTPDQVKALTALRDDFQSEAARRVQEIRDLEAALARLYEEKSVDLTAVEGKIKEVAARQGELRVARVKTLQKGLALLTEEQRQKLFAPAPPTGHMGA